MSHTNSIRMNSDSATILSLFPLPSITSSDQVKLLWRFHNTNNIKISEFIPQMGSIDPQVVLPTMLASEKILGLDWNLPEEDEAWQDL